MPLLSTRGGASAKGFGFGGGFGPPYQVDFLIIAGGSGSAGGPFGPGGGGGGAGGYRTSYGPTSGGSSPAESKLTLQPGITYTCTVAIGGAAYTGGDDSTIVGAGKVPVSVTSTGGGRFGQQSPAYSGGSGGGGGGPATGPGAYGPPGAGTSGQGSPGGAGYTDGGGGGGGAGASGADASGSAAGATAGNGGAGLYNSITGTSVARGGGGGGGTFAGGGGTGGVGGGGDKAVSGGWGGVSSNGNPGGANTGGGGGPGGGGSAYRGDGAPGGSGVIIFRIPTLSYSGKTTGSPTVSTDGSNTILQFTGTGTYTA